MFNSKLVQKIATITVIVGLLLITFIQAQRYDELKKENIETLQIAQKEYEERIKAERMLKAFHDLSETYRLDNNDLRTEIATLKKERDDARRASRSRRSSAVSSPSGQTSSSRVSVDSSRKFSITGYCATGNRTASGKVPRPGMVATLDRRIPFGTRVRIDGVGTFTVEDRIGHSSEFDIFFGSCAEARQFGRKRLRVEILG